MSKINKGNKTKTKLKKGFCLGFVIAMGKTSTG